MATLDDNDNYPLPDDWNGQRAEQFERLWRDHFKHLPPLDTMTYEQCEKFHEFVWEVYKTAIMESKEIENLLTKAYFEGEEDGQKAKISETKMKLQDVIDSLD